MKSIKWTDYLRVIAVAIGVSAFFTFILILEWENAEYISKLILISFIIVLQLLFVKALWIFFPRNITVQKSDIVDGPTWSATFLDKTFVKVKIKRDGKIQT